jgi:hypothetical protein
MYCKCILSAVSTINIVTVFIAVCNLSIKLKKIIYFQTCVYINFCFVLM